MAIMDVVDAVAGLMPGVPVLVGKKNLAANGAPPRLVFVPTRDRIVAPERIGDLKRPAIHTCWSGVHVHVWGADLTTAEQLRDQLLIALRTAIKGLTADKIFPSGYRINECGWLESGSGWANVGEVWLGQFEFAFPVAPAAGPMKTVTSIPITAELETPGTPPTEEQG